MFRSVGARFATALTLGALWLSAAVAPTAAVSHTRWVDDNTGPNRCHSANFSSIQDAIDASSPGDKVYVCPGNYQEQITIDVPNLEVRARPALGAKIWAPEFLDEVDGITAEVHISARDVKFVGFWLKFNDGDIIEAAQPITSACSPVDAAIWADGPHATIKANHIKTVGDNTLSGDCGYLYGIVLADPADGVSGGEWGADTSLVWRNWIRDFKYGGILVEGDRSARIFNNAVRYVHYYDPATCNLVPVLGVSPSLDFPCSITVKPFAGVNDEVPYSMGIGVEGALVHLRGNSVYSTIDTSIIDSPQPSFLGVGIVLLAATDGSKLRNNRVDNVYYGIVVTDTPYFAPPLQPTPEAPDGVAVSGNRASENYFGFFVNATDGYYYANRAHLNLFGIFVVYNTVGDNVFDHNDFRYNGVIDCLDDTVGGGTLGTANDWENINLGFVSDPSGLCFPFFPI